jgi:hypothetical protein
MPYGFGFIVDFARAGAEFELGKDFGRLAM